MVEQGSLPNTTTDNVSHELNQMVCNEVREHICLQFYLLAQVEWLQLQALNPTSNLPVVICRISRLYKGAWIEYRLFTALDDYVKG